MDASDSYPPVPDGYEVVDRNSNFLKLIGPIYQKRDGDTLRLGLRAAEQHCNWRGSLHGGVISTLADIALGYNIAFSQDPPLSAVTASLTVDYVGRVDKGDWMEVVTDIQKIGRRLAFANCFVYVDDKRVARANAVFNVLSRT